MKKIKKMFGALLIVFLAIFTAASVFVIIKGKDIAVRALEKSLNRKVAMESIRLNLPFSLEINNLNIEDLIKAKKIAVSPSIVGFFAGKLVLNKLSLIDPQIYLIRKEDGSWNLPVSKGDNKSRVVIANVFVRNGSLSFIDRKIDPAGFNVRVQDINLDLNSSILPTSFLNVKFNLASKIVCQQDKPAADFSAKGWVNLLRKDMKAKVELSDLDAVYFLPYYSNFLPSPLEKGRIFFTSDLNAKNNDLTADCHLKVKDLAFQPKEGKKDISISLFDIVTGGNQGENQEAALDFMIKTKLDKPRVDWAKITGSVVAKSLGEQVMNNPEQTIEKVKSLGKDLKSFGKDFLKKKAGGIFGIEQDSQGK